MKKRRVKKKTPAQKGLFEICEIFKNTFFDKTHPVDFLCITNPKLVEIETRLLPHYLKEGSYCLQMEQEKETAPCILTCPR